MPNQAEILKQQFTQSLGLAWQALLPESRLEEILREESISYRNRVYTPIVTLWAMFSHVFDPDKSLSNAVKRIISWLVVAGAECPSSDTGAYSKARQRFPERVLQHLNPRSRRGIRAESSRYPTMVWAAGAGD